MSRLLLIDGNSIVYRAYYGSAFNGIIKNSKGFPVNAMLTFNRMLKNAIDKYEPTHVLIAFDAGKKTKRHDKLESYKGGRSATPPELIQQFPTIKEMIRKMGINTYEVPEIEADDIVGTLAAQYKNTMEVLVMSSDKDLYQLVDDGVTIVSPQNGVNPDKIINNNDFFNLFGYNPNQVPDIKGLVGDTSDNLPGVKGIGEKGAVKLISEYGTLENIYANIKNIKGATHDKLVSDKEMALLCKEIATLQYNVEIPYSIDDMKFTWKVTQETINFYKKYELNSLVKRYEPEIASDYENILM